MSSQHLIYNNVGSTLASGITAGQTSFDVVDPVFPVISGNTFYNATLEAVGSGALEVVKVINVTGSTLTVERGAESTTPATFSAGDLVQVRTTAGLLTRLGQKSDLGVLYPFQTTVVTGPLDLYVDSAGSDVTGDGSVGAPWATPYKALEELQFIRFGLTGAATVNVAAGTYTMDAQLLFNHPQGNQIFFTSGATFQPITGMPIASYLSDRENPSVPGRGATEFHNTCGTVGTLVNSTVRATNRSNDAPNNRSLISTLDTCVFDWSSAGADESKLVVETALGGFENIALLFPPADFVTPSNRIGIDIMPGATFQATDLNVVGSDTGLHVNAGQLVCTSLAIAGARKGIALEHNGVLTCTNLFVQGSSSFGIEIATGSSVEVEGTYQVSGAGSNGIAVSDNSSLRATGDGQRYDTSGNEGNGLAIVDSGSVDGTANTTLFFTGNVNYGLFVTRGGSLRGHIVNPAGNNLSGLRAIVGAIINSADSFAADNNGIYGVSLDSGGLLEVDSFSASFNSSTGVLVENGASFQAIGVSIVSNGGRATEFRYSGPCRISSGFINTSNAASPHMAAIGGSTIFCPAPGSGGISPSVVFVPTHDTLSATGTIFTDESSVL